MVSCRFPAYISYITIAHFLASLVYLFVTTVFNFGTPFNDSLSVEQRKIKKESSRKRGVVFGIAFIICLLVLFILQPFVIPY